LIIKHSNNQKIFLVIKTEIIEKYFYFIIDFLYS
jgi:hypothetical protein